jgi:predicted transcriptional regulator
MKLDGQVIDVLLAEKLQTAETFSKFAEIPLNTLNRARRGESVGLRTAGKIARGLGVPVADIVDFQ